MLVIRSEQLHAFRRQRTADLVQRLAARLRQTDPARTASVSEDALSTAITAALAKAKTYGIIAEGDAFRFLEFTLRYGPQFGDPAHTPWAAEILARPTLQADEKLNLLDGYELYGAGRRQQ